MYACMYVCKLCMNVYMYLCVYGIQSLLIVCWLTAHYLNSVKSIGQECCLYTARRK